VCSSAHSSRLRCPAETGAVCARTSDSNKGVLLSRIVLLAADGFQNKQIAATLKVACHMVTLCRRRFLERGIAGLLKDAPRPARTPSITAEITSVLITRTMQSTPTNATQWSTHTLWRGSRASGGPMDSLSVDEKSQIQALDHT